MLATGTFSSAVVLLRPFFLGVCYKKKIIEILISVLTGFEVHTTIHHNFFSQKPYSV